METIGYFVKKHAGKIIAALVLTVITVGCYWLCKIYKEKKGS